MTDFKTYLSKYEKMLPVGTTVSAVEAERRASEFLEALASITTWKYEFSKEKIKLLSVQTAVYAEQLAAGTGKTVTENKVSAEASKEYTEARELFEFIENDINYLKSFYEIFMNAHLFYRQLSRNENV